MAYSNLLNKSAQRIGHRLRISGIKYYWVSGSSIPSLSDSVGGTDYTRVESAFASIPRSLPMAAHPLKTPGILTTDVELLDVDSVLTELWATEQSSPVVFLDEDVAVAEASISVVTGPASTGFSSFPSSGFIYLDGETIEYGSKGASSFDSCTRGKFAEGFASTDVAHDQYHLASSALPRQIYGFLPHLWYREVLLEIFDLDTVEAASPTSATIARGFLLEPQWTGEDTFRFRIANYLHPMVQEKIFKRSEGRGEIAENWVIEARDMSVGFSHATATPAMANPLFGITETVKVNLEETPEITDDEVLFSNSSFPSADRMWMPSVMGFALVGGEDGEIIGYSAREDGDVSNADLTVALRGCFGTPIGKDNEGVWPRGTSIQHLCVLAGAPVFKSLPSKSLDAGRLKENNWLDLCGLEIYGGRPDVVGVNPIDAFLMLATSKEGDGSNGAFDVLPEFYGLGIDANRLDIDGFEDFRATFCDERQHVYIAREPQKLLALVLSDIQALYGGMIYASKNGTISIANFRDYLPTDAIVSVAQADILSIETIGVSEVYNTLSITMDQWPAASETTINAYDYRRRDALGENRAPSLTSKSLKGPGWLGPKRFTGEHIVRNQMTTIMQMLGNGAPMVGMFLSHKHMDLEPGDYIQFTHTGPPKIIAASRGFSGQLAMVLEAEPQDDEAQIRVRVMLLQEYKMCSWGPSAEILARISDTVFTIKASVFSDDDRASTYWSAGDKIIIWDSDMTSYDAVTIDSYSSPTITLVAPGSANVQNDRRIMWDDWDTCAGGSASQIDLRNNRYGYFADSLGTLGASSDVARVWL